MKIVLDKMFEYNWELFVLVRDKVFIIFVENGEVRTI